MYNLIVTAEAGAWDRRRYSMPLSRLGEYSPESFKARYRPLDERAVSELASFPTLFAYEDPEDLPARVGRVTRITRPSGSDLRFEFEIEPEVPPISPVQLAEMGWDLDIGGLEMNRTHWAVKDVELFDVLRDAGLLESGRGAAALSDRWRQSTAAPSEVLDVSPMVFSIPTLPREEDLVAVMMPFSQEFDGVLEVIREACENAGLRCERAEDIWEDSTIIQDVFNLIFRSRVVIVDLSGRNGNVLYETGIAHTLGRPVVPISQRVEDLPFDLSHHRTLPYLPNEQGLNEMREKLERKLRSLTA